MVAPLIAQNRLLGYLYADMDGFYGRFTETDRDMMGMLANQAAVALDNAQWAQGLERKVEQRTAELNQRWGSWRSSSHPARTRCELDFQGIIDMVGDKLREVMQTQDIGINWYDPQTHLSHPLYTYEHGKRLFHRPHALRRGGPGERMLETRQPVVLNDTAELLAIAGTAIPGTDMAKCAVWVPIIGSDRVLGAVQIENHEREHAYGESEVRLLQTVAASMGVALENARLFDETQRLLKETRAAQRRARGHQQRPGRRIAGSSSTSERIYRTRSATRLAHGIRQRGPRPSRMAATPGQRSPPTMLIRRASSGEAHVPPDSPAARRPGRPARMSAAAGAPAGRGRTAEHEPDRWRSTESHPRARPADA